MSTYTPGTILSVGFGPTLEQVIVLTEDKVATKTFGGQPVIRRDIMSLQDWQIVVGSQVIQTDYMPVAVPETVVESVPVSAALPVAVQEYYPVGTKLSWKHPDGSDQWYSPNSRTAIVLKGGIVLQVKEVINGITSRIRKNDGYQDYEVVAQTLFPNVADWKSTLPPGGSIVVTEATEDYSVKSIERKAAKPIVATSDLDYINEVQNRFTVLSKLETQLTPKQRRDEKITIIRPLMTDLQSLVTTLGRDAIHLSNVQTFDLLRQADAIVKRLRCASKKAVQLQIQISSDPSNADTPKVYFKNNYKQRLMAFVGGREIQICASNGFIALSGAHPSIYSDHTFYYPKLGRSFADLGIDMKADGKPRLKVYYRCDSIEL
jgi:hypothetical protein